MPPSLVSSRQGLPITILCEFCGEDILKLAVNREQPARDVKVGVTMAQLLEHIFTCPEAKQEDEILIAITSPNEYDHGEEEDDDEPE